MMRRNMSLVTAYPLRLPRPIPTLPETPPERANPTLDHLADVLDNSNNLAAAEQGRTSVIRQNRRMHVRLHCEPLRGGGRTVIRVAISVGFAAPDAIRLRCMGHMR